MLPNWKINTFTANSENLIRFNRPWFQKRFVMKYIVALALFFAIVVTGYSQTSSSPYQDWEHEGSFFINSTPNGADLKEDASIVDFPLLVRLNKDFFDFSQALPSGDDIRFSTLSGRALSYNIEEWDAINGSATIWLKIPLIKGNKNQEIRIYWGNKNAISESKGTDVFNSSNGYLSVFHLNDPTKDEVGTVKAADKGTVSAKGIIGRAREFKDGTHIFCGDEILAYP